MIIKQYTLKEMRRILKTSGYITVRQRGSHEMWTNGSRTLAIPVTSLNPTIARRLIKENGLCANK
jgi:predicted RNA binding protein YcfA (HicA-like mRNA interferase family)